MPCSPGPSLSEWLVGGGDPKRDDLNIFCSNNAFTSELFVGGRLSPNGPSDGTKFVVPNLIKLFNAKFKFSAFRLQMSALSR